MTVAEILEQAKTLSVYERKELVKLLVDSLGGEESAPAASKTHWGQNLLRVLDELGHIELIHPEIEDPVEWVKQVRREQRQKRLGDWGENEE